MKEENVSLANSHGLRMAATITTPDGDGPYPAVLFVHGLGGHRRERHVKAVCDGLGRSGVLTLRVDLTNNRGESEGRFEDMTLSGEVADAAAALDHLIGHPLTDASRVGVAGHSFGGLVSALLAARDQRIRTVAPLSPVFDMRTRLLSMLGEAGIAEWKRKGFRELGGGMRQGYQFWEDLQEVEVLEEVSRIIAPLFVLVGSGPDEVPVDQAGAYVHHAQSAWKRFEVIGGASHTYPERRHLESVVSATTGWISSVLAGG
jgi:dienelactone hydrolase